MWRDLAQSCSWWWCFENCVVASERPTVVKMEENRRRAGMYRLHSMSGPALAFADGWTVHAVHGVRVPAAVIEDQKSITTAAIDAEENAEIRRVMVEQYGLARYLKDSGAKLLDESKWGRLWRKELPGDEPITMVEVQNSTPEPDGTRKTYFLRVHPECRPLLAENKLGDPQKLTAHNAVASTFGKRGEDYQPSVET
jgi:hypothetical protein